MFFLKKFVSLCLLPPLFPLLVAALGLLLIGKRPRVGRALAWGGLVLAVLFSSGWFVKWLLLPLEDVPVLTSGAARSAQAIVILGGGRNSHAPEYGGETVKGLTLERLRYGARLAREHHLPVLVTGGAPTGGTPEAVLMKRTLEEDFGVPVAWEETKSLDTRENARYSAAILLPRGVKKVILVSHAAHLKRAEVEFSKAGFHPILAPTARLAGEDDGVFTPGDFLPNAGAAYSGWYAAHEWLGLLAAKWRG